MTSYKISVLGFHWWCPYFLCFSWGLSLGVFSHWSHDFSMCTIRMCFLCASFWCNDIRDVVSVFAIIYFFTQSLKFYYNSLYGSGTVCVLLSNADAVFHCYHTHSYVHTKFMMQASMNKCFKNVTEWQTMVWNLQVMWLVQNWKTISKVHCFNCNWFQRINQQTFQCSI